MRRVLEVVLDGEGTIGGTQRHVAHILAGLDPSTFQADVVTWDIPQFVSYLRERDVDVLGVTSRHILSIGLVRRLVAHMESRRYDLVHAHGHRAGLIGRAAAIRAGVPSIVWTCHATLTKADDSALLSAAYRAVLRWLDTRTDSTIAVSEHMRRWLLHQGIVPPSITVVRNCVDREQFRPRAPRPEMLKELGLDDLPRHPVVGTVARLAHSKGVDCLIGAARRVIDARPDAKFLIVGGGPLENELAAQARELGIAGSVIFTGQRTDVAEILAVFDIAVAPSRSEGAFSYVPLEAMASRKPLICSDIPPFRDVVEDGRTALIFPVDSPDDLANVILRLLGVPEEAFRLADAGYELVRSEYDLSVMQRRMVELYESAAQKKVA